MAKNGTWLFIHYDLSPSEDDSDLLCACTLDEGQAVSGVLWEILKEEVAAGTFEWKPNANATGRCPSECVAGRASVLATCSRSCVDT